MPDVRHDKPIRIAQAETHGAGETHASVGAHEEEIKPPLAENPAGWYSAIGLVIALAVLGFGLFGMSKGTKKRNPSRRQTLLEQGIASITFFCRNAIGEGGEKFAPLVGTVFAFVLLANLMGVLPTIFVKNPHNPTELRHFLPAPTANLTMTLAISFWVFLIVNYVGIKENGFGGWLKHFCGPIPALAPLLFPIEFIGALVKPVSLSIRLFGNVFGEETVIAVLTSLAVVAVGGLIPFQFPMLVFGVFGGLVQAAVYSILTCAYIALSIGDHDDHGHGAAHDDIKDEFGAHVPAH
ncbi:MAG: F0F1 ATP synthase subunit A [Armatimonadetes bacterium]|nr:F0F1 ATP synthase subunit A [Armatimonadota bacterium]